MTKSRAQKKKRSDEETVLEDRFRVAAKVLTELLSTFERDGYLRDEEVAMLKRVNAVFDSPVSTSVDFLRKARAFIDLWGEDGKIVDLNVWLARREELKELA